MTKQELMEMSTEDFIETLHISQCYDFVAGEGRVYRDRVQGRLPKGTTQEAAGEAIKARKAECISFLTAQREEEKRKFDERQAKIDAIPGLKEIKKAEAEMEEWHRKFNRSFDSNYGAGVGGMGVGPKPQYDIKAMRAQYPIADAYLKAEAQASKSNYELSGIGVKAREAIIENPENYEAIMEEMEAELHSFSMAHAWD